MQLVLAVGERNSQSHARKKTTIYLSFASISGSVSGDNDIVLERIISRCFFFVRLLTLSPTFTDLIDTEFLAA